MAQNERTKEILPQIIVAVVIALVAGGTAPWWLNELFLKPKPTPTPVLPTPNPNTPSPTPLTPSPTVPPKGTSFSDVIGTSYLVRCIDNKERTIFDAIIQFTSESTARWGPDRGSLGTPLKIDVISPHRAMLSPVGRNEEKANWVLDFSSDYREATGTYQFLQIDPSNTVGGTRWRNYAVSGSKME